MATKKTTTTTQKPAAAAAKRTPTSRSTGATTAKKVTRRPRAAAKTVPAQVKPPLRPTKRAARRVSAEAIQKSLTNQPKVVTGFMDFLREQSVVGLAIGLVMGTQVKVLADQLIASFVNPLIGLVLPGRGSLDEKTFSIIVEGKTAVFAWGSFAATLLSFVITAAVIYFVFKSLKLDKLTKKKKDEAA